MAQTDALIGALRLFQGYIWHPKELELNLSHYLPQELNGDVFVLWDKVIPPFSFFDDGTLAASQTIYQFTVVQRFDPPTALADIDPHGMMPWLAEQLQDSLEQTPPEVGWQILEDLRQL